MQTSKEDNLSNELPYYEYISDEKYYELYESGNYLGIAQVSIFLEKEGRRIHDRAIYLQFDNSEIKLIKECIKEIMQNHHSDCKFYSMRFPPKLCAHIKPTIIK